MTTATSTTRQSDRAQDDDTLHKRKEAAVSFLRDAASGNARRAFARYAADDFKHHNAYFPGDAESLAAAMDDNAAKNPGKRLEVQHVVGEGDLVAVHSKVFHKPGAPLAGVVHIFRFAGDRVAELWDLGQEEPADSPNQYGMF